MERYVAIDNVCAWPNLTLLPGGEVLALGFNQPCHGRWEGDVACWANTDAGRGAWDFRSLVTEHEPTTVRMNHAAGLAGNGDMLALVSGWSDRSPAGQEPAKGFDQAKVLHPWVCRSADAGRSWATAPEGVELPEEMACLIPFGNIHSAEDGSLRCSMYGWDTPSTRREGNRISLMFRSADDGKSWQKFSVIGPVRHNETDILPLGQGRWLAAVRTADDGSLWAFRSDDDGATWREQGALTSPHEHPAGLVRLADGRVLLSYGVRLKGYYGVAAKLSEDDGKTFSPALMLVNFQTATDGGYPSSVQLDDGTILTAWYANRSPAHDRYHMGVLRWDPDAPLDAHNTAVLR
jgi:hypothetical protein